MRIKKIIQIFFMSLLCLSFSGFSVHAETITKDGLQVNIEANKEQYQENETAEIHVYVKNTNGYDVKNISVVSEIPKELKVSKDSQLSFEIEQLNANESKEYSFTVTKDGTIHTTDDNHTNVDDPKDETIKTDVNTGEDIPWLPLIGGFLVSGGALILLKKHKKKSIVTLLLVASMGVSALNVQPVKAQTNTESFQVDLTLKFGSETYAIKNKVTYDKQSGEINEIGEVTKEEWITALVDTMNVSIEDRIDAYSFDDFDQSEHADKIETAIQYQFLDVKANEDNMVLFEPKAYATREFVAYTAVRALGYVPTQEDLNILVDDKAGLQYPGEDNIALDLGMLYKIGNSFHPNQYVTKLEVQNMIDKTKEILDFSKIDKNHVDTVEFQDGVLESTLQYEIFEDEHKVIVADKTLVKDWKKDEVHVIYSSDKSQKDIAIKITSIVEDGNQAVIIYTQPEPIEIAKSMDFEGAKVAEGTFTPAEDVVIENAPQSRATIDGAIPLTGNKNFTVTVAENFKIKGSIDLKEIQYKIKANLSFTQGLQIKEVYMAILNENKLSISWEQKLTKPIKKEIAKFTIPVAYGVSISGSVYLNIEVDGSVKLSFSNSNKIGLQYNKNRLRPIAEIKNSLDFQNLEGNIKVGVGPEVAGEWFGIDLLKLGMDIGNKFELEVSDVYNNPFGLCIDGKSYLYSSFFAQIGPDSLDIKHEKDIFTAKNSPSKLQLHVEETGMKAECTRNSKGDYKGIVKDANTGQAIQNTKVQVLKGSALLDTKYSNRDGEFTGIKLSKGEYKLRVSASGYQPYERKFQIIGGETTYLETQLMVSNGSSGTATNCNGKVVDAFTGGNINDATIKIYKQHLFTQGEFVKEIKSDADGNYESNLPVGNYEFAVSKEGYIPVSKDITISTLVNNVKIVLNPENQGPIEGGLRFVLTWGEEPLDLDSHLTSENLHVWYGNKEEDGANLDVDDTSSYGPETITITAPKQQIYQYYIHDYSNQWAANSNALSNSNARIQVYDKDKLLYTFNVPQGKTGTKWHVFDIDYINDRILPVNEFSSDEYGGFTDGRAAVDLKK